MGEYAKCHGWETGASELGDLDPALVQEMPPESSAYTLDVLKDRLWRPYRN